MITFMESFLKELEKESLESLLNKRYEKFRAMGTFDGK